MVTPISFLLTEPYWGDVTFLSRGPGGKSVLHMGCPSVTDIVTNSVGSLLLLYHCSLYYTLLWHKVCFVSICEPGL